MINRRFILGGLALGAGGLALGGLAIRSQGGGSQAFSPFTGEGASLAIPQLYAGERRDGVRTFDLNLQEGVSRFFEGLETSFLASPAARHPKNMGFPMGEEKFEGVWRKTAFSPFAPKARKIFTGGWVNFNHSIFFHNFYNIIRS